ncbi:peptide ABC transporter permease [Microbacterium sp. 2FI]|uniref:peptide ABC transporter permease n=1 Tax=Microbacterium sp. 2FI TaxID=2502193 RepID=UPI0010F6FE38|nr:peptide ABC transporter permease [Microbacterium sp. 2FI]
MSLVATLAEAASPRFTQWHEPEPGFHVGSRKGDFIGSIEETAVGTFVAIDGRSTPVGRYASVAQAQRALVGLAAREAELDEHSTRVAQLVATIAGTVSFLLLVGAGALALPV